MMRWWRHCRTILEHYASQVAQGSVSPAHILLEMECLIRLQEPNSCHYSDHQQRISMMFNKLIFKALHT